MISICRESLRLFDDGQDFCVATIVSIEGSSPRHVGAKVLVRRDGSIAGTIGGVFSSPKLLMLQSRPYKKKFPR